MIDKLHLKAHLKDYYLNPKNYVDTHESEGRGEYVHFGDKYLQQFIPREFSLLELGIPLQAGIRPRRKADGTYDHRNFDAEKINKYWESIPSSYSGLAFKLHDYRGVPLATKLHCPVYLEFHASPAKLLQGHNIFGTDDIQKCKDVLVDVLLNAYPVLKQFFDFDNLFVSSLDITYFSRADSQELAQSFIDAVIDLSRGQTKARTGFKGATAYFGSASSKLKKLKVYSKNLEVMQFYKELQNSLKDIDLNGVIPINKIKDFNLLSVYTPELLEFTKGMIRFEATVKADWLRQRDYSQHFDTFKEQFDPQKIWQESFKDLFFLLESKTMTINDYNEDHIKHELQKHFVTYNKKGQASFTSANNAFKTFLLIKQCGYNKALEQFKTQRDGTKLNQTWYRHLEMLRTIGLIDIYLQGFKDGKDSTSTVVPLLIFSKVDFSAQFPTFYKDAA